MKKHLLLLSIIMLPAALAVSPLLSARESDWGSWTSVQASKKWDKAYSSVRLEHRSCSSFSRTECWFTNICGGYRFLPWLSTDLSYEFWQKYPESSDVQATHKIVLCATGTLRRDALSVALREKLEYAITPSGTNSLILRSRLRAQYSFKLFRPYLMAELFLDDTWIRSLYYAGTELSLTDHFAIDLFYQYRISASASPANTLGVGVVFVL